MRFHFSAALRFARRKTMKTALCYVFSLGCALPAAASQLSYAVPAPKPQLNGGILGQEDGGSEIKRRRLGTIEEQSPLLMPRQRDLFSAPPETAKPAAPRAALPSKAVSIADYPLNEALLARLEKIHKEILALPEPDDEDSDDDIRGGIDVLVKALEKRPDVMGILGRNLMGAGEYITACQAAANALAVAAGVSDSKISAANLAFGKKYADRIRALLEE